MRARFAVYLGVGIAFLTILSLGFILSPTDDFCPKNSQWNGLSTFVSEHNATNVSNLEDLRTEDGSYGDSVLFIVGPDKEFSSSEVEMVEEFLTGGGRVVLSDDFGSGNDLLDGLGIEGSFSGQLLVDPMFKFRNRKLPVIPTITISALTGDVDSLSFNYGTALSDFGGEFEVLAESSEFSFLVENLNKENESEKGSFPVLARREVGGGELILVSDPSLFLNGVIVRENNEVLVRNLAGGRDVSLDTSHWNRSRFWVFQDVLLSSKDVFRRREVRYGVLVLIVAIIFKFGLIGRKGIVDEREEVDEVGGVLEKHPDWDRETLEELSEED